MIMERVRYLLYGKIIFPRLLNNSVSDIEKSIKTIELSIEKLSTKIKRKRINHDFYYKCLSFGKITGTLKYNTLKYSTLKY